MAKYVTFEKGQCSRYRNANMVESEIEERMNPELLRAIVIGDLTGFNKILRMKAPIIDTESIHQVSLRGVTCGKNTALHVVAGVMEKSSLMEDWEKLWKILFASYWMLVLGMVFPTIYYFPILTSLTKSATQPFLFVFSKKKNNLDVVDNFFTVNAQWIQKGNELIEKSKVVSWIHQKRNELIEKSRVASWIHQKGNELIAKARVVLLALMKYAEKRKKARVEARRTRWLKWVFLLRNVNVLDKREMYMEIAKIIYRQVPTLLIRKNATKETPLHCAVKAGKLKMVSLLVNFAREEGPHKLEQLVWARNKEGETALHEAARFGYSDIVKVLLSADEAVACLEDRNGISPLYLAVAAGFLDVVRLLIAPNRPTSYSGPDKQTALHAAVMTQEENIMWVILEWKPDIAAKADKAKNTPLHYATSIGNINAVKQLLLKDTKSVYEANSSGSFPVHLAAEAGNFKVIKELLRTCPDVVELLDNEKRNFLHIAVEKKKIRVIMLAFYEGINTEVINAKDKDGNTPLHLAVINSESEIFALLCQNKRVNLHIRNEAGLTPLDLSASLKDHQFTYTLNPQSIIHRALVTRGAFQNPCQPGLSKKVNNFLKPRSDRTNQREGKEMLNGVEVDIEKESTKYENMSKSLITGAVLIASATFASIFTVSGVYKGNIKTPDTSIFTVSGVYIGDKTPDTSRRRNFFMAFIIVNMAAFLCAIVSTIGLLYSALSNFHLKYRKFYFKLCTSLLYVAINLFILTFGLGAYIAVEPLNGRLALVILLVSGIVVLWNIICSPKLIPLIFLAPYASTEFQ